MNTRTFLVFAIFAVTILTSCSESSKKSENSISEGIIEYDAKVLNEDHPLAMFAPNTATVKLKDENWQLEMSNMGFHIFFICKSQNSSLSQMVKFMDFQNACIDDSIALEKENQNYKLLFKETSETKLIAGYKCKKLIATKASDPTVSFDVYYTPEIGTEQFNELTPYKGIKGMLMDYRMVRLGLEMHFIAKSAKKAPVENTEFEIPANYNILPRDEFDKKLNNLLNF